MLLADDTLGICVFQNLQNAVGNIFEGIHLLDILLTVFKIRLQPCRELAVLLDDIDLNAYLHMFFNSPYV